MNKWNYIKNKIAGSTYFMFLNMQTHISPFANHKYLVLNIYERHVLISGCMNINTAFLLVSITVHLYSALLEL